MRAAETTVSRAGLSNVSFQTANIFKLPFPKASFDHVFACFVLEHLKEPAKALRCLKAVLKPGGTLMVIEGDHSSTLFHPRCDAAWKTIQGLIDLQAKEAANLKMRRLPGWQEASAARPAGFSGAWMETGWRPCLVAPASQSSWATVGQF